MSGETEKDGEGGKKVENKCDRWGRGRRLVVVVGGEVCLQPSTGGWGTHTPNHASAERAKWKRVGGNETEDETSC